MKAQEIEEVSKRVLVKSMLRQWVGSAREVREEKNSLLESQHKVIRRALNGWL